MILIVVSLVLYGDFDATVKNVMHKTGWNHSEAVRLIAEIDARIQNVGDLLSDIASAGNNEQQKKRLANELIDEYFESEWSTVQVSNKFKNVPRSYTVRRYLDRLSELASKRYSKVILEFDKEYLSMGHFVKIHNTKYNQEYQVNISVWQVFRGYKKVHEKEIEDYSDATKKTFRFRLYEKQDRWHLRIHSVVVSNTIPFENYEGKGKWH